MVAGIYYADLGEGIGTLKGATTMGALSGAKMTGRTGKEPSLEPAQLASTRNSTME